MTRSHSTGTTTECIYGRRSDVSATVRRSDVSATVDRLEGWAIGQCWTNDTLSPRSSYGKGWCKQPTISTPIAEQADYSTPPSAPSSQIPTILTQTLTNENLGICFRFRFRHGKANKLPQSFFRICSRNDHVGDAQATLTKKYQNPRDFFRFRFRNPTERKS